MGHPGDGQDRADPGAGDRRVQRGGAASPSAAAIRSAPAPSRRSSACRRSRHVRGGARRRRRGARRTWRPITRSTARGRSRPRRPASTCSARSRSPCGTSTRSRSSRRPAATTCSSWKPSPTAPTRRRSAWPRSLREGAIGSVRAIDAVFGYDAGPEPTNYLMDPTLARRKHPRRRVLHDLDVAPGRGDRARGRGPPRRST